MQTNIEESIKIYGKKIDDLLKEIIPPDRDDYLSEPIWHHLRTGGKRIRPAICLITCKELGGNPDEALHFALAIEILHNILENAYKYTDSGQVAMDILEKNGCVEFQVKDSGIGVPLAEQKKTFEKCIFDHLLGFRLHYLLPLLVFALPL